MPGRDSFKLLDIGGWAATIAAFAVVLLHASIRIFKKGPEKEEEDA
jgi:hypothetical protein